MQLALLLLASLPSTILASPHPNAKHTKTPAAPRPLKSDPNIIGTTLFHGKDFTGSFIYSTEQTDTQGDDSGCTTLGPDWDGKVGSIKLGSEMKWCKFYDTKWCVDNIGAGFVMGNVWMPPYMEIEDITKEVDVVRSWVCYNGTFDARMDKHHEH